ncbi:MAG: hypothetical protein IPK60_05915 [Sandaracinaceae bacterium]|nr:hypothetical protein [Sandaracinaceae bacterium]
MSRLFAWLIAAAALLVNVDRVSAQDARASALIEQGLVLRESGDTVGALELFQAAYDIEPSPRALAQIALAHQALGQWVPAFNKLTEAMSHTDDAWIATRTPALTTALNVSREHIGFVNLSLAATASASDEVWIDGAVVPHWRLSAPIAAEVGMFAAELHRHGVQVARATVRVDQGATANLTLAPAAQTVPQSTPSPSWQRPLGLTLAVVGGAGVASGVIFHILRESAAVHANDCTANAIASGACTDLRERQDAARSLTTLSIAGYVAGGSLLVAGALMLVLNRPAIAQHAYMCGPTTNAFGLGCVGTF